MTVTVKLFATFRSGRFRVEAQEYPSETTVRRVVDDLGLEEEALGMVMLNGRHASLEQSLREGDTLSLFPLVGGG